MGYTTIKYYIIEEDGKRMGMTNYELHKIKDLIEYIGEINTINYRIEYYKWKN